MADAKAPKLTPEEQAAADAQATADAKAREVAGAPPAEADKQALEPATGTAGAGAKSFDVLHGAVGAWMQGTVVTAAELKAANVDEAGVQRLLDLGAIVPHQDAKE